LLIAVNELCLCLVSPQWSLRNTKKKRYLWCFFRLFKQNKLCFQYAISSIFFIDTTIKKNERGKTCIIAELDIMNENESSLWIDFVLNLVDNGECMTLNRKRRYQMEIVFLFIIKLYHPVSNE